MKETNQCDACKKFKRWEDLDKVEEIIKGVFVREYYTCKDDIHCWKIKCRKKNPSL